MKTKLSLTRPAYETYKEKTDAAKLLRKHIEDSLASEFGRRGGCLTCKGRGWIVTDESNGLAYAEYDECPDCTAAERERVGMLHPLVTKHDKLQGTKDPLKQSFEYDDYLTAQSAAERAKEEYYAAVDAALPDGGDRVVIVRGPKHLRGLTGTLTSALNNKAHVELDNGDQVMVAYENLEALIA